MIFNKKKIISNKKTYEGILKKKGGRRFSKSKGTIWAHYCRPSPARSAPHAGTSMNKTCIFFYGRNKLVNF